MKTPSWWHTKNWQAQCLRPVSAIWRVASWLRIKCAKAERLPVPVWCVGNVTAGGGGKTPFCLYLGEQMQAAGIKAYFISRGYGGTLAGPVEVEPGKHTSKEVGDEALLLAACLPTIVAKKRIQAARTAVKLGAQMIIMDDGLQYPHLHKDKTFLMLKGHAPLGNGYLIPAGPLREPLDEALGRSDVVVQVDSKQSVDTTLPVWRAATALSLPQLPHNKVIAFAGIAEPERFKIDLERAGLEVVEIQPFADHYAYKETDLTTLIKRADDLYATLITTAKDAVRIGKHYKKQIAVAEQSLTLTDTDQLTTMIKELTTPAPL